MNAHDVVTIYCSGGIRKGPQDDTKLCWTDAERTEFASGAAPAEVVFLEPADPVESHDDILALFGRDMYQVQVADAVVVDARQKRGIGIGVEMAVARQLGTPLVCVVPHESHYRKANVTYRGATAAEYLHPHIFGLADAIVEDFRAAGLWVFHNAHEQSADDRPVLRAIDRYRERMLPGDAPMLDANRRAGR